MLERRHSLWISLAIVLAFVCRPGNAQERVFDAGVASANAARRTEIRDRWAVRRQAALKDYLWVSSAMRDYAYAYPAPVYYNVPTVFEPWPFVPGDLWGFPVNVRAPQPIDQVQIRTGPHRWESHPVYAEPARKRRRAY